MIAPANSTDYTPAIISAGAALTAAVLAATVTALATWVAGRRERAKERSTRVAQRRADQRAAIADVLGAGAQFVHYLGAGVLLVAGRLRGDVVSTATTDADHLRTSLAFNVALARAHLIIVDEQVRAALAAVTSWHARATSAYTELAGRLLAEDPANHDAVVQEAFRVVAGFTPVTDRLTAVGRTRLSDVTNLESGIRPRT